MTERFEKRKAAKEEMLRNAQEALSRKSECSGSVSLTLDEARIVLNLALSDGDRHYNKIRYGLMAKVRPVFDELKKPNVTDEALPKQQKENDQ